MKSINSYQEALQVLQTFCACENNMQTTDSVAGKIANSFLKGNKVIACGNGGSLCDAMHFCEELTGQYRHNRRALPAISLSDSAHITCVGNDFGFEEIFSRGVEAHGNEGDWLIALSTSGNSENIIRAVTFAKKQGINTFALIGKDGGKLKGVCDFEIIVPANTSDRIQEVHMIILHIIIEEIERKLFPENYSSVQLSQALNA